jgi:uncharacterized protein
VRVEVDRADQMRWEVPPQDPQFLNRELVISRTEARFDMDTETCRRPAWRPVVVTWGELFAKGFRRPEGGGRSTRPTPADFEFDVKSRDQATVYALCPGKRLKGSDLWLEAEWVVLLAPGTLVMHRDSQVLLVFERRASDARPRASFPCEKAASPTEKAICGSFDLAGWDRSVAEAYRQALHRNREHQETVRDDQKAWLKNRDACGDRVSCIDELLWRRVEDLTQD